MNSKLIETDIMNNVVVDHQLKVQSWQVYVIVVIRTLNCSVMYV